MLFVGANHKAQFAKDVDPASGELKIKLERADPPPDNPLCIVKGRVLDPDGGPVVGATVWPRMIIRASGRGSSGLIAGVPPLAITDRAGEFIFTAAEPLMHLDVQVEARGLATANFNRLAAGERLHELKLQLGTMVTGRILKQGEPVAGVLAGLVQADRNSRTFVGEYVIGTDKGGRFQFFNVAPDFEYCVYGKMDSLKHLGTVPFRRIKVGQSGATVEAGDLQVEQGHRLRGRVVLSDGRAIPPDTQVLVSREQAWDSQRVPLDADGWFEVHGLPREVHRVGVRLKGYRFSLKNKSIDRLNPFHLVGRIDRSITDLTILLEPGEPHPSDHEAEPLWLDQPLMGIPRQSTKEP